MSTLTPTHVRNGRRLLACLLAATLAWGGPRVPLAAQAARPRLLVVLVVDQMRADYIDKFRHQWRGGLRRLVEGGARFERAAYPYLNTVTCAGHATIGTGNVPARHGIVLNAWWDRDARRMVTCTADPQAKGVGVVRPATEQHSAWRLRVPTLADELRVQSGGGARIVTLSLKARSAIMLAGQRSDATIWMSDDGAWMTSSAYTAAVAPAVEEFVRDHPVDEHVGAVWEKLLAPTDYLYDGDTTGSQPPGDWGTWPHHIGKAGGPADKSFYEVWKESPLSDEYLARMAAHVVDRLELGQDDTPDFLGISFSALDYVGHDFGPDSHEVQDLLARLDRTLDTLLTHLDTRVGRDNYVVALSADHGVSPVPERVTMAGLDAGRIDRKAATDRLEGLLTAAFGEGRYVDRFEYTDLYFAPGVMDRLESNPAVLRDVVRALESTRGIWRVFNGEDLRGSEAGGDASTRAAALSYHAGRSGDLIMVPQPYWLASSAGATHGTSHGYDSRVPVLLYGFRIKPGVYADAASPADIAPTLAYLSGVTLANPDGDVLWPALVPAAAGAERATESAPRRE